MPGQLQEGFGCVVTNRFDQLFDDEEDPFELLKQAEKKKDATAPGAAKTAAQAAKQSKKESQKERRNPVPEKKEEKPAPVPLKKDGMRKVGCRPEQQGQPGSQPQGGQGEGRPPADRRPDRRPPRERRFDKPADEKPAEGGEFSVEKSVSDRPFRGRGGPRGGRGGRGRGVGRTDGFDSRGKREFDRHSGSDRTSLRGEEKRGGSGSHNWGNVKDELSELDQSNVTEDTPEGEEHPPADSENKENEVEEVKEEGAKEMTLDEWKAQQNKERAKVEFNIRKANEGADWKKGYVLHKSKAEDASVDDASGDHHFRKSANDITSKLEINFGDLGRTGRGRGGPRGGRGGRGAAAAAATRPPRERRPEKVGGVSVPNVDDPEAFPALA
ncbi:plasminogen activator inhibitor 1 RNA-binding protein isoform X1 [Carassius gibelio]|uniref:plasminogen activator inhibitor 1 RNA-binding protein isoform X1 n=1 Tax=Carassius gibelio TaxID=101364 RepID=UPI002278B70D|nr:plasminogen activator inhibitor 1 RNA-binding protein isoform X1 [Carassius gibelio]